MSCSFTVDKVREVIYHTCLISRTMCHPACVLLHILEIKWCQRKYDSANSEAHVAGDESGVKKKKNLPTQCVKFGYAKSFFC
jgi:hypothetical protein